MASPCDSFRDEFLGAAAASERPGAHRSSCEPCAAWARRVEGRERALSGLERLAAPEALDGAVVAALEAGFRQDRAVAALSRLGRVSSPRALDHALSGELLSREQAADADASGLPGSLPAARRLHAPSVLADLVSEELGDPAGHRVRRYVGSLERLAVPAELAERLAAEDWSRPPRRPVPALAAAALGALGLAVLALGWTLRSESPRPPRYDFVVEVVDDPSQLAGLGAGLLDGVSGGVLSAGRL